MHSYICKLESNFFFLEEKCQPYSCLIEKSREGAGSAVKKKGNKHLKNFLLLLKDTEDYNATNFDFI